MRIEKFPALQVMVMLCFITTTIRSPVDLLVPALPAIQHAMHVGIRQIELTITAFFTGFAIAEIVYGPISDRFGRRKTLFTGYLIFLIGNTLCSVAPSIDMLYLGRFISGLGIGVTPVILKAISRDYYPKKDLVQIFVWLAFITAMTMFLAPLVGAYVQTWFGWRADFIILDIYVATIFIVLMLALPETNLRPMSKKKQVSRTLLHFWRLATNPFFLGCSICIGLVNSGFVVFYQVSPLILEEQANYTAIEFGWLSLFAATGYILGGTVATLLLKHFKLHTCIVWGVCFLFCGGVLMYFSIGVHFEHAWLIFIPMIIFIIGMRIIFPILMSQAMLPYNHHAGLASSANGGIHTLTVALVSFIAAMLHIFSAEGLGILFLTLTIVLILVYLTMISKRIKKGAT